MSLLPFQGTSAKLKGWVVDGAFLDHEALGDLGFQGLDNLPLMSSSVRVMAHVLAVMFPGIFLQASGATSEQTTACPHISISSLVSFSRKPDKLLYPHILLTNPNS